MVEHWSEEPGVVGPIPTGATKRYKTAKLKKLITSVCLIRLCILNYSAGQYGVAESTLNTGLSYSFSVFGYIKNGTTLSPLSSLNSYEILAISEKFDFFKKILYNKYTIKVKKA